MGIIGVVAALTLPVLTANINDKVLETQNLKAQSVFANGLKLLMTSEDVTNIEDTSFYKCNYDKTCMSKQLKGVFKIVDDNNENVLKTEYEFDDESKEVWSNTSTIPYTFITSDGIIFGILKDDVNGLINAIVDINGTKKPNKGGKDLCKYSISQTGRLSSDCEIMKTFNTSVPVVCGIDNLEACSESECRNLGLALGSSWGTSAFKYENGKCVIDLYDKPQTDGGAH